MYGNNGETMELSMVVAFELMKVRVEHFAVVAVLSAPNGCWCWLSTAESRTGFWYRVAHDVLKDVVMMMMKHWRVSRLPPLRTTKASDSWAICNVVATTGHCLVRASDRTDELVEAQPHS